MKNKIVNLDEKRKKRNSITTKPEEFVRIPILDKFYYIDGELMYEIKGDPTPRKMKDYDHMNFN